MIHMKHLGKFMGVLLTAAATIACCAMTAFADGEQEPQIVLKESGVRNQYTLKLDKFSSKFESVQFDICIDKTVDAPEVEWRDNSSAHFQRVDTNQEDGKTVLTVYIDRLRPIANSNSIELADLTFKQSVSASSFSVESDMTALDGDQEKTVFPTPSLTVTSTGGSGSGSNSGGSWSSDDSDDDDDDDDNRSNSSGEGSGIVRVSSKNNTILDWNAVFKSSNGKSATVKVKDGQVISQDILRQAAQEGSSLKLDYGDFTWVFDTSNGVSIPSNRTYYDFSVNRINYKNLSVAVENSDLLQFEITYSGQLPCRATLSFNVGSNHAGETVYLSYYNENEAVLQYLSNAVVSPDGIVSFTFTHASKYVLSLKNVWNSVQQDGVTTLATAGGTGAVGVVGNPAESNPNSGIPSVLVPPEDKVEHLPGQDDESVLMPAEGSNIDEENKSDALNAVEPAGIGDSSAEEPSSNRSMLPVLVLFLVIGVAAIIAVVLKLRIK